MELMEPKGVSKYLGSGLPARGKRVHDLETTSAALLLARARNSSAVTQCGPDALAKQLGNAIPQNSVLSVPIRPLEVYFSCRPLINLPLIKNQVPVNPGPYWPTSERHSREGTPFAFRVQFFLFYRCIILNVAKDHIRSIADFQPPAKNNTINLRRPPCDDIRHAVQGQFLPQCGS